MPRYELGDLIWRITGDTTNFDRSIASSDSKINKTAQSLKNVGATLTKFVTLPLIGVGAASVKAASDLEESLNAVRVVFEDSAGTINEWGQTAAQNAGLSQSAFNTLATVTGALLKQSGQDLDDVADDTINLTQRAADLASVFNTDVSDALGALNAALRGESEPARRFAINISDAAVQAEALTSGLADSADEITDQIKVQARYNLIMKQSADVAGDFANTSDSLENQTRILKATLVDVGAELGTALLPIVQDVVGGIAEAVEWFANLDEGTKRLLFTIAGIAAASGPVIGAIGTILKLKDAIIAMNAAALFGPIGAIAGIAALAVGIGVLIGKNNDLKSQRMEEEFKDIAAAAGLTGEQLLDISNQFSVFNADGVTAIKDVIDLARELGEEFGKTPDQILEIAERYNGLNDRVRDTVQAALSQQRVEQDIIANLARYEQLRIQEKEAIEARARAQAEAAQAEADAIAEALRLERERVSQVIKDRVDAERATAEAIALNNRLTANGLQNEIEARSNLKRIYESELETLSRLKYTLDQGGPFGQARVAELIRLIGELEDATEGASNTAIRVAERQALAQIEYGQLTTDELTALENNLDAIKDKNSKKELDRINQERQAQEALGNFLFGLYSQIFSTRSQFIDAELQSTLAAIDRELNARLEAAGLAEDTELERLEKELAAAKESGDDKKAEETQQAIDRLKIVEEYEKKKAQAEYKAALASWEIQRLQAIGQTAQAAINAYSSTAAIPIIGPVLAPFAALAAVGFGIAQQVEFQKSKPQPPAFALGGDFLTSGPQLIQVGDNPGGVERVSITPESSPNFDGPGRSPMVARVYLDGRQIAEAVFDQMDSGNVRIPR